MRSEHPHPSRVLTRAHHRTEESTVGTIHDPIHKKTSVPTPPRPTLSWGNFLRLFFTIFIFGYIFYKVDLKAFVNLIRSSHMGWLLFAFLTYGLTVVISIWRWHILLQACHSGIRWTRTAQLTLIGLFANSFMLGSMGGDLLKAYYIAREYPTQKAKVVISIFMDRLLGFFAMFILSTTLILNRYSLLTSESSTRAGVYLYLVVMGLIAFLIIFGSWQPILRIIPFRRRLLRNPYVRHLLNTYTFFLSHKRCFWGGLGISFIAHIALLAMFYFIARGVHMQVNFFDLSAILPLVSIVTLLPVTVNGMGLREFAFIHFLAACNIPGEQAIALSLGGFLLILIWNLIGGIVYLPFRTPHRTSHHA